MEITHENNRTIYSSINSQFVALIENGLIFQVNSFTGQKVQVGVLQQTYDELQALTEGYYQKLVEAGIIKEPKAPEQIIEEQQKMMNKMLAAIEKLNQKVEELENVRASNETV